MMSSVIRVIVTVYTFARELVRWLFYTIIKALGGTFYIMRYTTIIDITECPQVYSCMSARLIYLHLVLKSGWGQRNLDYCACSIRSLQGNLGLSFAAVRHGLQVLEKYGMIRRGPGGCYVRKFCAPTTPGVRKLTHRQQAAEEQRRREQEMLEAARREREAQTARTEARLEEERQAREARGELPPDWLENSQYKNLAKLVKKPK